MKTVLITGAYGGMGRAVTHRLANRGYRVFALDLRVDAPEENVYPVQADLTSEASVKDAYEAVQENWRKFKRMEKIYYHSQWN